MKDGPSRPAEAALTASTGVPNNLNQIPITPDGPGDAIR
jgi:hypothetical protein